ncbi:hypothetical protein AB0K08_16070 [Citricoccus sp. NPDC055426]|uniref:hypothetical protein n=1 Tax=Citricoccus sp. NPDC055426 TaxID=3155536 RepID=UPI00343699E7
MSENLDERVDADAKLLLKYMDANELDGAVQVNRGQAHIGGLIVDSALQRQRSYANTVAPRVAKLIDTWPDAETTSGFRRRLKTGELGKVIAWRRPARLDQIENTTAVLERFGIDTTGELRDHLSDEEKRPELRAALDRVKWVGAKTLDYFDILCGITDAAAIDSRIYRAAGNAQIANHSYDHLEAVLTRAAELREWRLGDLDAVLWAAHKN